MQDNSILIYALKRDILRSEGGFIGIFICLFNVWQLFWAEHYCQNMLIMSVVLNKIRLIQFVTILLVDCSSLRVSPGQ